MKRKTGSAAPAGLDSRRKQDIAGLVLSFLGVACFLWLVWRERAPIPGILVAALRWLAGSGAYAIPVVLLFVGCMLLFGYRRFSFSHATAGSLLGFLAFLAFRHLTGDPGFLNEDLAHTGPLDTYVSDPAWSVAYVAQAGGYLGAVTGWALASLVGRTGALLFLAMLALIALVLVVDKPVADMIRSLRKPLEAGARIASGAGNAVRERRNGGRRAEDTADERERPARVKPVRMPQVLEGSTVEEETEPSTQETGSEERRGRCKARREGSPLPLPLPSGQEEKEAGTVTPAYQPYRLPPTSLLWDAPPVVNKRAQQEMAQTIKTIEKTLEEFGIEANVVAVAQGPTVTRYEIQLGPGIKVARITSLADNLALALAAINVRVEAPIPGKNVIGVEVPNSNKAVVSLKECIESPVFRDHPSKLAFALGKDVAGEIRVADLTAMPHLLIGGATNSGKSVCLNTLIASIVYRARPDEVKFVMVDPKRVELTLWDGIPHLIYPVVRDVSVAASILRAAIREMDRRYDRLASLGARNIVSYNDRVPEGERMPYIVVIIDELADLMAQAGPEIEAAIERLAHLARATGIHLVIATQRPSVDVITGTIKANIPSRIAFACIQAVDSRTILDRNGAERLIGRGDMLFLPIDAQKPVRIQGCFISEGETEAVVEYLRSQDTPEYTLEPVEAPSQDERAEQIPVDDALFEKAVRLVVATGHASASLLQRRMRIGYARASRLIDIMEQRGLVGPPDGAKPREVLITRDELDSLFAGGE